MTLSVTEAARSGRFQPLRTAAFERLAAGDHAGALPYALAAEELFPRKGEVPFWLACIHSRLGEPEAAVVALRAGLARGMYWPRDWLEDDDDLEPLRGRADFEAVVREAELAAARVPQGAPLAPVLLASAAWRGGQRRPRALVLALHGWGQDAAELASHWEAAAASGLAIAVARSSQEPCPGFFVWDDRTRALGDVTGQLEATRRAIGAGPIGGPVAGAGPSGERAAGAKPGDRLSPVPLVLAGFSQGGGVAVDLALDGLPAPARAVLVLAAGLDDLAAPPAADRLETAAARGLRAALLVGERDDALDDVRGLADVLARAGLGGKLTVLPDVGHEVPEPPGEVLAEQIGALLG